MHYKNLTLYDVRLCVSALQEYEDLDEIIARFVQPMAGFARDVTTFKYFRDTATDVASGGVGGGASASAQRDLMEKLLYDEKRKAPSKIPYFLSPSKELPGKFMLSYLPRKSTRHETLSRSRSERVHLL